MDWQEVLRLFLHDPKDPLLFHTGFFLFIFSIFLIAYSFVVHKNKIRNVFIIIFSLYFYYKASGLFVILLLLTVSLDYLFSTLIKRQKKAYARKLLLFTGIMFSLSFLMYFKYRNFLLENLGYFTHEKYTLSDLILPVGISFYTFQSISYLVDTYRKQIALPGFLDYMLYMTFFPHLVAGPIVRARDFIPQLKPRLKIKKETLNEALYLITKGLIKKAIIADFVAQYSDIVFATPDGFTGAEQIMATLCYSLQIFCDFSGYTDMAIGVALLLGFRLKMNFDSPYKAHNITQFWRRWHISLSSWLRDYIYISFGGNRRGVPLQLLFLLLTMLIGGFWHGADWKFVFWGGAHGMLLILNKLSMKITPGGTFQRWFTLPSWIFTFVCVSLLWVPFRASSIDVTWMMYTRMFTEVDPAYFEGLALVNPLLLVFLFLGFGLTLMPNRWKTAIRSRYDRSDLILKVVILVVFIQIMIQLRTETVQPFIYFQF